MLAPAPLRAQHPCLSACPVPDCGFSPALIPLLGIPQPISEQSPTAELCPPGCAPCPDSRWLPDAPLSSPRDPSTSTCRAAASVFLSAGSQVTLPPWPLPSDPGASPHPHPEEQLVPGPGSQDWLLLEVPCQRPLLSPLSAGQSRGARALRPALEVCGRG